MKFRNNYFDGIGALLIVFVFLVMFYGYIINIIEISISDSVNGMVILRVIGIFIFPFGSILGFV